MRNSNMSELIRSRRTVHDYSVESIDENLVEEALELGLWAPNHKMTIPWRYCWLGPEGRKGLAEVAIETKIEQSPEEPLTEVKKQAIKKKLLSPAQIVLLGQKKNENPRIEKEDYASIACAVQNMSLYLWDQGVDTKWSTGKFTESPKTYKIANWSPSETTIVGAFLIGIALRRPTPPPRPSLSEVLIKTE